MSSIQGQDTVGDDRKGISKFIRRASRVLKPKSAATIPDNQPSMVSVAQTPEARATGPLTSHPAVLDVATSHVNPQVAASAADSSFASYLSVDKSTEPTAVEIPRRDAWDLRMLGLSQHEKAQALFAKYGLTLEDRDWTPLNRGGAGQVEWVEKKVRVRVHRQCHSCGTSFGSIRECVGCSHVRCKKCPRFPAKAGSAKDLAEAEAQLSPAVPEGTSKEVEMEDVEEEEEAEVDLAALVAPPVHLQIDPDEQTDKHILASTSGLHQMRGQNLAYRPPTHRVRRYCHKCEAMFKGRASVCESCGHQRCPNCPRDPAKSAKFSSGYPGDVPEPEQLYPALERVWRKPRHRVRYTCEQCNHIFANSGERECRNCKHVRCDSCVRFPPRKSTQKPSEDILKSLEGRLDGLQLLNQ